MTPADESRWVVGLLISHRTWAAYVLCIGFGVFFEICIFRDLHATTPRRFSLTHHADVDMRGSIYPLYYDVKLLGDIVQALESASSRVNSGAMLLFPL